MRRFVGAVIICTGLAMPGQAETSCKTVGNITQCDTAGNLAPTQRRGCIALTAADGSMNPADLAVSVLACAKKGRAADAAELMVLMMARGRFDMDRIADKTAHQGIAVLQMEIVSALAPAKAEALQAELDALAVDTSSPKFAKLCGQIAGLGVPKHDPGYMIAHGINAFTSGEGDGLVPGFQAKAAWTNVMQSYLKCPG